MKGERTYPGAARGKKKSTPVWKREGEAHKRLLNMREGDIQESADKRNTRNEGKVTKGRKS